MTLMLIAVAWVLTYLAHSTLLLGGAWALSGARMVRSHAARDVLWKVALLGGLVTATAQLALRVQPATGHVALAAESDSPLIEATSVFRPAPSTPPNGPVQVATSAGSDATLSPGAAGPERRSLGAFHAAWPGALLNLWLFAALACGARLIWARAELARRLRSRRDVVDGPLATALAELMIEARVTRPVRLTVADDLSGPISLGATEICLPARAVSRLGPEELRAVLAHELGHLVRRDPWWQLGAAVVASVLCIQPLNRLARRRMQEVAEYLCDDWAAARAGGGLALARCLAEVATWMRPTPELAAAPGLAARPSQLVARVERLLEGGQACGRAGVRMVAVFGIGALGLVAWGAPGVAAEDLAFANVADAAPAPDGGDAGLERYASLGGEGWLAVREGGTVLVMGPGFTTRLTGHGRIGFRQWGRVLALPDGYTVTVDGNVVSDDLDVCDESAVRILDGTGAVAWTLHPVRLSGSTMADPRVTDRRWRQVSRLSRDLRRGLTGGEGAASGSASLDEALDGVAEAKLDAALDTLVRAWARDPQAVRVSAQRIARTFERDLVPQLESLGVELGRVLTPRLERVSDRLGRDLSPEFARMGVEIGRAIAGSLGDLEDEPGAGTGDYRKPKPKTR